MYFVSIGFLPPFLKKNIYFELMFGNIQSLRRAFDEN